MSSHRRMAYVALVFAFIQTNVFGTSALVISPVAGENSPWRKDLPAMKGKIQRWLREVDSQALELKTELPDAAAKAAFLTQGIEHELQSQESQFSNPPTYAAALNNLVKLKKEISEIGEQTETKSFWARYHRLLAVSAIKDGKRKLAEDHFRYALQNLPAEVLPSFQADWELLAPLMKKFARWQFPCEFRLKTIPEGGAIDVNGFALGSVRSFHLPQGSHRVRLELSGFEPQTLNLSCRTTGLNKMEVKLSPLSVAKLEAKGSREVRLWVKEEGEKIRLFLETPGVAFSEVTRSKPIAASEFFRSAYTSDAPITEFKELLGYHLAAADFKSLEAAPALATQAKAEEPVSWYQDWRFWTLAGVLVTGITASLVFKDRSRVDTTH